MNGEVKTFYKGLGFCGGGVNSNTCEVDVKDGASCGRGRSTTTAATPPSR